MAKKKKIKCILTGGKTGGHAYPVLGFCEALKELGPEIEILWIGLKGGLEEVIAKKYAIPIVFIPAPGPYRGSSRPGKLFHPVKQLAWMCAGVIKAAGILMKSKADFVFSSGSFVGTPALAAAVMLRKPYFLQEQNVRPGRANRIFKRKSKAIFYGYQSLSEPHAYVMGTPLRKSVVPREDALRLRENSWRNKTSVNLLVIGGSQGAVQLNSLVLDSLDYFKSDKNHSYVFTHLTGRGDLERVKNYYDRIHLSGTVYPFCEDMARLYKEAHIVISRAGAVTLAEANAWALPLVLFPLMPSIYDHQRKNAEWQRTKASAVVLVDGKGEGRQLYETVRRMVDEPETYLIMSAKSAALARPQAGRDIAGKILELMKYETA